MFNILRSFQESVRVMIKHVEKTCVSLWDKSTIFKVVWDVTREKYQHNNQHNNTFPQKEINKLTFIINKLISNLILDFLDEIGFELWF